jgi:hypothetical protein
MLFFEEAASLDGAMDFHRVVSLCESPLRPADTKPTNARCRHPKELAMPDLQQMTRVLYRHDWTSVDQWVRSLDDLADLTDEQIDELERLGSHGSPWSCDVGEAPLVRQSAGSVAGRRLLLWDVEPA